MLAFCAPSGLVGCGGTCPCYVAIGLPPMLTFCAPSGLVGWRVWASAVSGMLDPGILFLAVANCGDFVRHELAWLRAWLQTRASGRALEISLFAALHCARVEMREEDGAFYGATTC
jgi:hypothetical protein